MKLEKLLEQIQRSSTSLGSSIGNNDGNNIEGTSDGLPSGLAQSQSAQQIQQPPPLLGNSSAIDSLMFNSMPLFGFMTAAVNGGNFPQGRTSSINPNAIVPIGPEETTQGLLAVGGCRQCARTFTDRLELIHHFVDHFPSIFYSFEDRAQLLQKTPTHQYSRRYPGGRTMFPKANGSEAQIVESQNLVGEGTQFWGQLASFLANGGGSNAPPQNDGTLRNASPPSPADESSTPNSTQHNALTLKTSGHRPWVPTTKSRGSNVSQPSFHQMSPPITELQKRQNQKTLKESAERAKRSACQTPISPTEMNGFSKANRNFSPAAATKRSLSDLPYHMCPHCCLTFGDSAAYNQHLAAHEEELGLDDNGDLMRGAQQKFVECTFCQMKFASERRLSEHMKVHTIKQCEKCTKTFMTAFDLNLHMGTHSGHTYDCKDCGKCFPCRKSLAEHNKSHRVLRYRSPTPPQASAENSPDEGHKLELIEDVSIEPDPLHPNAVVVSLPSESSLEVSPGSVKGQNNGTQKNGDAAVQASCSWSNNSNSNESDPDPDLLSEHSSLFGANPFLNKLLRENPRKRRNRGSRRQGEKSRRQATLVAREVALDLDKTLALTEKRIGVAVETEKANGMKEEDAMEDQ